MTSVQFAVGMYELLAFEDFLQDVEVIRGNLTSLYPVAPRPWPPASQPLDPRFHFERAPLEHAAL